MQSRLLSVLVPLALMSGLQAASAADMPLKAPPPAPVAVYNWTGCYVGLNAGWKDGRFHDTSSAPAGTGTIPGVAAPVTFGADYIDLGSFHTDSGAVGGQVGCRWETASHWVFGVEGDADWTDLHGTLTETTLGAGRSVFIPGDSYDNRAHWESSLRGIVGRSFGQWLIYGTGGLAVTNVSMTGNFIPTVAARVPFPGSVGSDSKTLYGYTVGAGVAYAINQNWDIGAEYRYSQYQGQDFGLGQVAAVCAFTTAVPGGIGCVNSTVTGHKDLTTNEVLFRLNYKFNPSVIVAKY